MPSALAHETEQALKRCDRAQFDAAVTIAATRALIEDTHRLIASLSSVLSAGTKLRE